MVFFIDALQISHLYWHPFIVNNPYLNKILNHENSFILKKHSYFSDDDSENIKISKYSKTYFNLNDQLLAHTEISAHNSIHITAFCNG